MIGSRFNPRLTFSQPVIRSAGAHTNATSQQPAAAGGGGGGGTPSTLPKSGVLITNPAGTAVADLNDYNVQAYGAVISAAGSAAANVTAINTAIAAMNAAGGGRLFFPGAGYYYINASLTAITVPCEICGMGMGTTGIIETATAGVVFALNTSSICYIHDIAVAGPGGTSTVAGITVGSAAAQNSSTRIIGCEVTNFLVGIDFVNCVNQGIISDCTVSCSYGILVGGVVTAGAPAASENSAAIIQRCLLVSSTIGVYLMYAQAISITDCQFIGNPTAIQFDFKDVASQSDLWIIGNHIEANGAGDTGIYLNGGNLTGAHTYSNVVICANEFAELAVGITTSTGVVVGPWLQVVSITGNVFFLDAAPATCLALYETQLCTIDGNVFNSNVNGTLFSVDASCKNIVWGTNSFGSGAAFGNFNLYASLPAAAAGLKGMRSYCTDATSQTFGANPTGGGGDFVPVFCTGAAWLIG